MIVRLLVVYCKSSGDFQCKLVNYTRPSSRVKSNSLMCYEFCNMTSLLSLPKYIQLGIYADFLTVGDVCFLDSACGNKKTRSDFLGLWKSTNISISGLPDVTLDSAFLRWLYLRGIRASHLNILLNALDNTSYLQQSFESLSYLVLNEQKALVLQNRMEKNYTELLKRLFNECRNLNTFCINGRLKGFAPLIANCQSTLTKLDLNCQALSSESICSIMRCSKLKDLNLMNCVFTKGADLGGQLLVDCPELLLLNVESCAGFDDILLNKTVNCSTRLTHLNIAFSGVSPDAFSIIAISCFQLNGLVCSTLTRPGMEVLFTQCTHIQTLIIHYDTKHSFSESALTSCVSSFVNLRTFHLLNAKTFQLYPGVFPQGGLARLTGLTDLSLAGCSKVSDNLRYGIGTGFKLLTRLDLTGCGSFTIGQLLNICQNHPLVDLNLSYCELPTALPISTCCKLVRLNLTGISVLLDETLKDIVNHNPLEVLHIKSCKRLTSAAFVYLAQNCNTLRELHIDGSGVTDQVLDQLQWGCPELRILNIESRVVTVTSAAIAMFKHVRRRVKLFY